MNMSYYKLDVKKTLIDATLNFIVTITTVILFRSNAKLQTTNLLRYHLLSEKQLQWPINRIFKSNAIPTI